MLNRPNLLIILTDQERAVQHWPAGWAEANLPAMQRLREHGLDFTRAFTSTSQCSPSRATLHTGVYPAEHGVTTTFGPAATLDPPGLRSNLPNLARALRAAGYAVHYKGKWHLTRPLALPGRAPGIWHADDVDHLAQRYGYAGWNPPDAGNSLSLASTLGAGRAGHDRRYVQGAADGYGLGESALAFLRDYDSEAPFCLFVSLVNPHDVFAFPNHFAPEDFSRADFADLPIDLPPGVDESLDDKPRVQRALRAHFARHDPLDLDTQGLDYVRFYAWLHTLADAQIGLLLDALDARGLTDSTLVVRTSDHGEMGLAHGGLRQKEYNCYEETLRVPLVFSNPTLFPRPASTDALAGLVDLFPTLAALAGAPSQTRAHCRGVDLRPVLGDPSETVQDCVHFTYDDEFVPGIDGPAFIRCVRAADTKYAVYFDPASGATECELYDLASDPQERVNLAHALHRTAQADTLAARMHERLRQVMAANATLPDTIAWPLAPSTGA